MKKLHIVLALGFFFLLSGNSWAQDRYVRAAGGNYNAAGTWELTAGGGETVAVPTASDAVIATALSGQLTITAAAVAQSVDASLYLNTITHNAFTWTVSGSVTLGTGMTYTPLSTSTITIDATGTLTTAGKLLPNLRHTGGNLTLGDNLSFMDSKIINLVLDSAGTFDMNGKSINGQAAIKRVLLRTTVLGTAKTITNATTSFTYADFRDINFSPATPDGDLDLSAVTGLSGDCGGNTIVGAGTLTFTPGATMYWHVDAGNWSDATKWFLATNGGGGAGRVPLPQDNATIDNSSFDNNTQTLVQDMPRMGRNIVYSKSNSSNTFNLNSIAQTLYGSLTMSPSMIITSGSTGTLTFEGRGDYTFNLNGKTMPSTFLYIQPFGGSLTLLSNISVWTITFNNGTFDANNFNVTAPNFASSNTNVRTLYMGSGTWTLSGSGSAWGLMVNTNLTLFSETSTIAMTNTASGGQANAFAGGQQDYYDLIFTGGGTNIMKIDIGSSFNTLTLGAPKTYQFADSAVPNKTYVNEFVAVGTAGNLITLTTEEYLPAIIEMTGSGVINADYLNLQGVNVEPAGVWYYGDNSVDGVGLVFDGINDVVTFGNLGNITNISINLVFRLVDDQQILTINGATTGAVTVAAGVLTFGASLSASNILVDGVSKTATEAGALLNDNSNHTLSFDLTSVAASDFRVGTNSSAYGELFVNALTTTGHSWTFSGSGSTLTDSGANNGTITGATWANTGWNSGVGTSSGMRLLISDVTPAHEGIIGAY